MNSVELIGSYGGDITHACSAWQSTDRTLTPEKRERIPKMLKDLAENGHHTPFEKSALHFTVTSDIASHIHLLKHRIGVSINAESARYKEIQENRLLIPEDWPDEWKDSLKRYSDMGLTLYHECLDSLTADHGFTRKRAKETARFFRPYNTQIQCDIMFNFRSFMHFQGLRNDDHAQDEIHLIAKDMLGATMVIPGAPFKHSLTAFGYGQ